MRNLDKRIIEIIQAEEWRRKPSHSWRGRLKTTLVTLVCYGVIPVWLVSLCFTVFGLSEA